MNILIDILPDKVEIKNREYGINYDFRTLILINLLLCDNSISEKDKVKQALNLFYQEIPFDIGAAIERMSWFNRCGKEIEYKKATKKTTSSTGKRILDYEKDADLIYSAFMSQYKLDLQDIDYLHWWKFQSLLNGLKDDNKLCEIMKYRSIDLSKIKDKEQKKFYKEMQEFYSLDDGFTLEELKELEEEKNNWK